MKMKTLTQVNAKANYNFDPRDITPKYLEIQARVAHAISIWSCIEGLTTHVVLWALGADVKVAAAMYSAITSSPASNAALKTAVRLGVKPKYAEIFDAIWMINGELVEHRHRLAHWHVGYSDEIPNALLLFNPKDGFLRGAENLTHWHAGKHEKFTERPTNKIRVASVEYLDAVIAAFLGQMERVRMLLALLRVDVTQGTPRAEIRQRYAQLYNEPQIHQILLQARARRKNMKATQRRRSRSKKRR